MFPHSFFFFSNRTRLFPESAVRNIMFQILQGLAFIHKHGRSLSSGLYLKLAYWLYCFFVLHVLFCSSKRFVLRVFPPRHETRESLVHGARACENSRLWTRQRDPISAAVHGLRVHEMVIFLLWLYCPLIDHKQWC